VDNNVPPPNASSLDANDTDVFDSLQFGEKFFVVRVLLKSSQLVKVDRPLLADRLSTPHHNTTLTQRLDEVNVNNIPYDKITNVAIKETTEVILFDTRCCHMDTTIKHPVPDRVKPSFVIFDIWAL